MRDDKSGSRNDGKSGNKVGNESGTARGRDGGARDKDGGACGKSGFGFERARGLVALACLVFVLVGMALHAGIGTPSAFGLGSIAAICPLGALETMLGAKGAMLHPLLLLAVTVVLIALVGKAFCGWMCPVPWLQRFFRPAKKCTAKSEEQREGDAAGGAAAAAGDEGCEGPCEGGATGGAAAGVANAHRAGAANSPSAQGCSACARAGAASCGKALSPVGGKRDGMQIDSRHAVLAGALASAAVFGFPVFCLVCPVGIAFATVIGLWNLVQFNEPSWALVVFPAILILEVTVLRKWCAKICPISALVGLLANLNVTLRPRVKREACLREQGVDCHVCVDACPEQLDPHSGRIPECSKCGACVEACPAKAISVKLLR